MAKTAASLVLVAIGLFCNLASAQPASSSAAVHINDQGCGMFDGNGGSVFTTDDNAVITSSGMTGLIVIFY
jgi:hypothetical protein